MRYNIIVVTLIGLSSYACNESRIDNSKKHIEDTTVSQSNISKLEQYHNDALVNESFELKKQFVLAFPDDFKTFNSVYGFDDVKGKMPLYESYVSHVNLFCNSIDQIQEFDGIGKLIRLAIDGHWDADAVELLQQCIIHHVTKNPNLAINELRRLGEGDIKSFWNFFYDGPHPSDKSIEKMHDTLFEKMSAIDTGMASIMRKEYLQVLEKSELHGQ